LTLFRELFEVNSRKHFLHHDLTKVCKFLPCVESLDNVEQFFGIFFHEYCDYLADRVSTALFGRCCINISLERNDKLPLGVQDCLNWVLVNFDWLHAGESGHARNVGPARGVATHDQTIHGVVEVTKLVHLEGEEGCIDQVFIPHQLRQLLLLIDTFQFRFLLT